jgi:hypothetical protein
MAENINQSYDPGTSLPEQSDDQSEKQSDEMSAWIVVEENLRGTENQCIGIAHAMGLDPEVKHINLNAPWKQLTPYLRVLNRYAIDEDTSDDVLSPPFPDILIAGGRKSIPASLAVKNLSGGQTFTVQLLDPKCPPNLFDAVIVPQHDDLRGENVIVTEAGLHHVTQKKLMTAADKFADKYADLPDPKVAVLIGGSSNTHELTPIITGRVAEQLESLAEEKGAGLMITASRRTGADNEAILRNRLKDVSADIWNGTGDNPYFGMLGLADYIIVTEDSVSMVSEAIATGKPVYIIELEGSSEKFDRFYANLFQKDLARPFTGELEDWDNKSPNDVKRASQELWKRFERHRMATQ